MKPIFDETLERRFDTITRRAIDKAEAALTYDIITAFIAGAFLMYAILGGGR